MRPGIDADQPRLIQHTDTDPGQSTPTTTHQDSPQAEQDDPQADQDLPQDRDSPQADTETGNPGDLNDLTGKEWIKRTKSWFICDSRRYHANRDTELHPARYPEEMVVEFLMFFTRRDGWVLDPFCGSGATLVSCAENDRRGVGVELSPKYARMAESRLPHPTAGNGLAVIQGDARDIARQSFWQGAIGPPIGDSGLPQFDFIITSPPYWNMLRKSRGGVKSTHKKRAENGLDTHYSDAEGDLGNIEGYDEFIEELGAIFDDCARLLKPDKYLVCVVQNCRVPSGEVKPFAWDLSRRIAQSLSFQGERIWCQNSKKLGIWGYPSVFVPNYHHHYCLIFQNKTDD